MRRVTLLSKRTPASTPNDHQHGAPLRGQYDMQESFGAAETQLAAICTPRPHSRSFPRAILGCFLYREGPRNSKIQVHVKTVGARSGRPRGAIRCLLGSTSCTA